MKNEVGWLCKSQKRRQPCGEVTQGERTRTDGDKDSGEQGATLEGDGGGEGDMQQLG